MGDIVIGGRRTSVTELIGKGGEGEVYAITGQPGQAVKIYNIGLRQQREDKVRAMVDQRLSIRTDLVAYPSEVVTDSRGRFLGFVMRRVSGYRALHDLYSPKSRHRHFKKADYRFIIRAALNIARAVGKVHQTGCVIGDLNHSSVLVAQDATVALIDADSFQFSLGNRSFPCVVGVPEFTPPELHGKRLASARRTIEHDSFGLAVAIFHLLFMGRHPYAGCHAGPDISMGDAIAQNRFAFSLARRSVTLTSPPPGALTLDTFSDALARAFENAFGLTPSMRPNALGWIDVLTDLEGSLSRCRRVKTHYYPSKARACVWCKQENASGLDMFPDLSTITSTIPPDRRGTEQAIREILGFRFPTETDLLPALPASKSASKTLNEKRSAMHGRAVMGLLMLGGAVVGFILASSMWIVWVGLAIWGLVMFSEREELAPLFQQAFKDADEQVQQALDAFVHRNGVAELVKVRGDLDAAIADYRGHGDLLARELAALRSSRESRQRGAYLDRFSVRSAGIAGIGPAKTATLISFGIETAADVERSAVMRVPGFGDVMTGRLMAWRRGHESSFKYRRTQSSQDVEDERRLRGRLAADLSKVEATIRNGLRTLRSARLRIEALSRTARSDRALKDALAVRAQAEHDLRELGASIPSSTVSLAGSMPRMPRARAAGVSRVGSSAPRPSGVPRIGSSTPHRRTSTSGVQPCPRCSSPMRRRSGRYGKFWGCSRYPACRGTRNI